MPEETKEPRQEEIFWEKAKEVWKQWKVTISVVGMVVLAIIGLVAFTFINWTTGMFRAGGFSAEVDAAMIQSLFMLITIPATLFIGTGTILVTIYFNRETQKIAIQAQRSALRDKIMEKRMEIYSKIEDELNYIFITINWKEKFLQKVTVIDDWEKEKTDFDNLEKQIEKLWNIWDKNKVYISKKINGYLYNLTRDLFSLFASMLKKKIAGDESNHFIDKEFEERFKRCQLVEEKIRDKMKEETNLEAIEADWKYLQQTRIEEEATEEAK